MGVPSRRVAVLALPFVVVALLATAAVLSTRGADPRYYVSIDELVADGDSLGEEVFVGGTVVSCEGRTLILRPEDSDSPTLTVVLADGELDVSVGEGIVAIARGIHSQPDVVTVARVLTKSTGGHAPLVQLD